MYWSNVFGKDNLKHKLFHVPIGNSNYIEMYDFDPHAPKTEYVQYYNNTHVLIILGSTLFAANEHVGEHAAVSWLSSYLSWDTAGFMNKIFFPVIL